MKIVRVEKKKRETDKLDCWFFSILDTLIEIVLSHAYNPWHFLVPWQVKILHHHVVYLNTSRNLCLGCHCILCKENEKAKFSSRWQASGPGVSEKLMKSSLLFILTLNLPSQSPSFSRGWDVCLSWGCYFLQLWKEEIRRACLGVPTGRLPSPGRFERLAASFPWTEFPKQHSDEKRKPKRHRRCVFTQHPGLPG